ncbi:MAG: aspartate 1-decarboxylase [Defluviitaleaceae bacterium]|nr:aspartate 1-decarboxylase [Defluviitaleaceae bacterium]
MIEILHSKIHQGTITGADLHYEGSISISKEYLELTGIKPYQKVLVADIDNGQRFETYVILAEEPNTIVVNGSAARLVHPGDKCIIMAFEYVTEIADNYEPKVIILDEKNNVI